MALAYLEWHRARQLKRKGLSEEERKRWRNQRTHGMCTAVRNQAERADLKYVADALRTPSGIRRLRRQLDDATQTEYRTAV